MFARRRESAKHHPEPHRYTQCWDWSDRWRSPQSFRKPTQNCYLAKAPAQAVSNYRPTPRVLFQSRPFWTATAAVALVVPSGRSRVHADADQEDLSVDRSRDAGRYIRRVSANSCRLLTLLLQPSPARQFSLDPDL